MNKVEIDFLLERIKRLEIIEKRSIEEDLALRNTHRLINLMGKKKVFCPLEDEDISGNRLGACSICQYGHLLTCHFPFNCSEGYCVKYPEFKDIRLFSGNFEALVCIFCNERIEHPLNPYIKTLKGNNQILKWINKIGSVKDIFPELSPEKREILISRTCIKCQNNLYR